MTASSLQDLYSQKLQLLVDAEHQALEAMPQLAQRVQNDRLRTALQEHMRESEGHVQRLQQLMQTRGQQGKQTTCLSMRALIQEAQQMLPNIQDRDALDAFVIAAAQAIEHHELASYGTARTWARQLGFDEDANLLQQTLDEEGDADKRLSSIAERSVNRQAAQGADREVDIRGGGHADQSQPRSGSHSSGTSTNTEQNADLR